MADRQRCGGGDKPERIDDAKADCVDRGMEGAGATSGGASAWLLLPSATLALRRAVDLVVAAAAPREPMEVRPVGKWPRAREDAVALAAPSSPLSHARTSLAAARCGH